MPSGGFSQTPQPCRPPILSPTPTCVERPLQIRPPHWHPNSPWPSTAAPCHQQLGWGCFGDPWSAAQYPCGCAGLGFPRPPPTGRGHSKMRPRRPLHQPCPLHPALPPLRLRVAAPSPQPSAGLHQGGWPSAPLPALASAPGHGRHSQVCLCLTEGPAPHELAVLVSLSP